MEFLEIWEINVAQTQLRTVSFTLVQYTLRGSLVEQTLTSW